jgi:CheY-like chemotaxis protein
MGRLSSGIAHDFNNILSVILGVSELLLKDIEDPDLRGQVEEIVHAGERGATLTRQFLAFGRKQVLQPEVLELNDVVRNLETMLRRLIREDIALVTVPGAALWRVEVDPGQIEQVLINLAVNARDAMPNGGTLTIETANVDLDGEEAKPQLSIVPGPHVMLGVSDTGHGMDNETKKRIFEPFFTTKPLGKGTGLGLATVYGIVRQSGGDISVDSTPDRGTVFKVYLPRSAAEAGSASAAKSEPPGAVQRGLADLQVLVVEDEPPVRRLIERMLARLKCRVTVAASGDEALAAVTERRLTPDLLITDTVMPGMSGTLLAERLRERRPGLKVLRMSGHADNSMTPAGTLESGTAFLQKPFDINQLEAAMQNALGSG